MNDYFMNFKVRNCTKSYNKRFILDNNSSIVGAVELGQLNTRLQIEHIPRHHQYINALNKRVKIYFIL